MASISRSSSNSFQPSARAWVTSFVGFTSKEAISESMVGEDLERTWKRLDQIAPGSL